MLRKYTSRAAAIGTAIALASTPAFAQSFSVGDKEVQAHGSIQQGFVVGTGSNFLLMDTNDGSAEMTDGAFNLSTQLTRKLRVGGQLYARNIGDLGQGDPQIDWAFADYRFHEAFGVRGGKVKTPMGLYNDTQDMEFLHTWALLPQGTYPLDLRSVTIAHIGADAYGTIPLKKAGKVHYSVYGGAISDDEHGGYRYGMEDRGLGIDGDIAQRGGGLDARWSSPVDGLMGGYSFLRTRLEATFLVPSYDLNVSMNLPKWDRHVVCGDFQKARLHLSGEWRRDVMHTETAIAGLDIATLVAIANSMGYDITTMYPELTDGGFFTNKSESWFASASVRVLDRLEVGSYHTRYVSSLRRPSQPDDNHVYDTAVTGRIDLNRFWNVKVEGHFIDGYGDTMTAHGFYLRDNPQGFQPTTKLLVVRTGVSF